MRTQSSIHQSIGPLKSAESQTDSLIQFVMKFKTLDVSRLGMPFLEF